MSRLTLLSITLVLLLLPAVAPAEPAHKRPAPRWHGYGFLPGYLQPPNNSLPAYKQRATVTRMAQKNRRHWYIDPVPSYYGYDGNISGGPAFTAAAIMAAASARAGRGPRSARSGIAVDRYRSRMSLLRICFLTAAVHGTRPMR